ncbi:MAG: hypothetical protein AAFP26_12605 [Planctomycetota bacterium]
MLTDRLSRSLGVAFLLSAVSLGAPASAQADGFGSATVKGGSPFETVTRDVNGMGVVFDERSNEAFLYTTNTGSVGRGSAAAVVRADVPGGRLGIAGCGQAKSGGVVLDASARSEITFDETYRITSDTLPDGTPVTLRFRVQVSYRGQGWHSNGDACAPQRSTHSGSASVDIRAQGPGVNRYRESGTVSETSCQTEQVFTGLINAQLAMPEDTLWATGSSEATLDAVVGSQLTVFVRLEGQCGVATQFAAQKGRTSYFAGLGFGFTFDQDAGLEPLDPDPMLPPPPPPPGIEILTHGYVDDFIPPDPLKDCPVDLNCDTFIDVFDVIEFLGLFDAMDAKADWNLDGLFDIFDVIDFLAVFELECEPIVIG